MSRIEYAGSFGCDLESSQVYIGNAHAFVNYSIANSLSIQNNLLHPWEYVDGVIGLGYCGDNSCSDNYSPFQKILMNSSSLSIGYQYQYGQSQPLGQNISSDLMFGLDLNPANSSSSMQLGYIKEDYKNNITWIPQAFVSPVHNQLWLYNLQFCGQTLLSNYSNNWQAIVDTGSACLSLPAELYNTLTSWFNVSSETSISENDLPTISFSLTNNLYHSYVIPLSNLLVNAYDISSDLGAINITVNNVKQSLCILKSHNIVTNNVYGSPTIIIGTLALHSLYFAVDFVTNSSALVSKISYQTRQSIIQNNLMCKPPATCIGEQTFNPQKNSCVLPSCSSYLFTELNELTQTCQYSSTPYGFGVFFIITITLLEFVTFFTLQFTAKKTWESQSLWENAEYSRNRIDSVTCFIGLYTTAFIDYFVLSRFKRHNAVGISNEPMDDDSLGAAIQLPQVLQQDDTEET